MKNKNYIIIGVAIIILASFLIWLVMSARSDDNVVQFKDQSLSADNSAYDFGNISMSNGKVIYEFKIKSSADSQIKKIYTSCMCTEAEMILGDKKLGPFGMPGHRAVPIINQPIGAGEEFIIRAIFDPAAHGPAGLGKMQRQIYIEEQEVKKPLTLNISAFVEP